MSNAFSMSPAERASVKAVYSTSLKGHYCGKYDFEALPYEEFELRRDLDIPSLFPNRRVDDMHYRFLA
ncbi:unnamed protein product [Linum trigynum]|uniref:Uncharacterized protein n=1 Tax=Linum trigynum TaxID=586398 RepID=A0AAV2DSA6_9ROSI